MFRNTGDERHTNLDEIFRCREGMETVMNRDNGGQKKKKKSRCYVRS